MRACGFLTQLVPTQDLVTTTDQLTARLTSMAPLALLGTKKHLNRIARGALDVAAFQADMTRAAQSNELLEGTAAWAARRAPQFTGR